MIKIIKLISSLLVILNLTNSVFAESKTVGEGIKKYKNRIMKNLNFCFKEVLFLILRMLKHIYI